MKKTTTNRIKKISALLATFFLILLFSEEMLVIAQGIRNQQARMDVRGTSRRTARRVDRRHDYMEGNNTGYVEPAPAAAAAATAAVLYSLPGNCADENGLYNCNGIYYEAQMEGTTVVYVQVQR
ncbi:hypothetical protein I5M27_16935 [Adhaeribacter sp. BT258]|uniref:Uncharacterized protein n=1 Tax=Adhaeribacter terrigena TaxID=2793070 RepID=A0ABS1C5L5_9BACT|nr:hypothetical protein [Adhaeribacter terrigena]MBK0404682.1 hypothetical protein [Adhaeribacter terrigena]